MAVITDPSDVRTFQRLAVKANKKSAVPDRTNWHTMKDLNRYRRQQAIRLAILEYPKQQSTDSRPTSLSTPEARVETQMKELLDLVDCRAKRLATAVSETNVTNEGIGMSEAFAAELRELKELVDVDVDVS